MTRVRCAEIGNNKFIYLRSVMAKEFLK